ncbi:MAG: hypothetical protein ABSE20_12045 [Acetobacteraceae bacterium]|jgi:hypothetical protein
MSSLPGPVCARGTVPFIAEDVEFAEGAEQECRDCFRLTNRLRVPGVVDPVDDVC